MSTLTTLPHKVLAPGDGLRIPSGPGRDLIFKVTAEDTGGAAPPNYKIDSADVERVLSSRDGMFIITRFRGALGYPPI